MISVVKQEYQDLRALANKKLAEAVSESSTVFSSVVTQKQKHYPHPAVDLSSPRPRSNLHVNLSVEPTTSLIGPRTGSDDVFIDLVSAMSNPGSEESGNSFSEDSVLSGNSRSMKKMQRGGAPFGSSQPRFKDHLSVPLIGG